MILQMQNFLRGSLLVDLRGGAVERFLNLCAANGVGFWDVRALDADHFTAWVSIRDYFSLAGYAKKTGCRVRVCTKKGAPFGARRLARRWALWMGLLVSIGLAAYLSGFVWTIEVRGCQQTTQQEVLRLLQSAGLKTGVRRSECRPKDIRNQVMLMTDQFSYLTVNFRGIQAIVEVWEREHPEEKPHPLEPCDVVSDLAGIVVALRVRTGQATVKVGDMIQPGDRIAQGMLVNPQEEVTLLHAQAEADLRTWYTLKTLVPCELRVLQREEKAAIGQWIQLGGRRFPLGRIEKNRFSWYDKQIETHRWKLQENFQWPIAFSRETAYLCRPAEGEIDPEKLSAVLEERMTVRLLASKPDAQLVQADFSLEKNSQGAWIGVLEAELVETTGREVPIQ